MRHNNPLVWPVGIPRTPVEKKITSRCKRSFLQAINELDYEIRKAGLRKVTLTTNAFTDKSMQVTSIYRNDTGVCLYYMSGEKHKVMYCDRYQKVTDNIHAITQRIMYVRKANELKVGSTSVTIDRTIQGNLFA